jgi:hypothetical protein
MMSTNATTLHGASAQSARAGLAALLAAIVFAAAAMVAVNAGPPAAGIAPASVSDGQVQKALIDVRAGERASRGVAVPTAAFWAEFRASERAFR